MLMPIFHASLAKTACFKHILHYLIFFNEQQMFWDVWSEIMLQKYNVIYCLELKKYSGGDHFLTIIIWLVFILIFITLPLPYTHTLESSCHDPYYYYYYLYYLCVGFIFCQYVMISFHFIVPLVSPISLAPQSHPTSHTCSSYSLI